MPGAFYLPVTAGDCRLLIASDQVREVAIWPAAERDSPRFRAWRGETLPVVNLPAALRLGAHECRASIVLDPSDTSTPDATPLYADVSDVGRLVWLENARFQALPKVSAALLDLFDSVCRPDGRVADGNCYLRIRHVRALLTEPSRHE